MKKVFIKKIVLIICVISLMVVTLFSNVIKVKAADFKYSEFNWDKFQEERKDYWDGSCKEDDEICNNRLIKQQKKFYVKLYKILAKYESQGYFINDNVIIETIFLGLTPSNSSFENEQYKDEYDTESEAINYDPNEDDNTDLNIDDQYSEEYADYYNNETDTLKTLIKNAIGYSTNCYGIYGIPQEHTADDGSKTYSCDNGGTSTDVNGKTLCASNIGYYELGFWKYYTSRFEHELNRKTLFLNKEIKDENYDVCMSKGSEYPEGSVYIYNNTKKVSYKLFFEFLQENKFFDKKAHLQQYFKNVFEKVNSNLDDDKKVECMTNNICPNSLENLGKYDEYKEEIEESRKNIIDYIKKILEDYGINVDDLDNINNNLNSVSKLTDIRNGYYWPIGSNSTENKNGITFASDEPETIEIISYFGKNNNGENTGIDIKGEEGKTNVIASYQGEVQEVIDTCIKGDTECNDGYGNMVIISHSNGDYTVYAYLDKIDKNIDLGTSVSTGQVIGSVGTTGKAKEPSLHFEIRVGGKALSKAEDPLKYIDSTNPRPKLTNGDFSLHFTNLTKEEFCSKVKNHVTEYKSEYKSVLADNCELVYDESTKNNLNPEFTIVRAIAEGFSPGYSCGGVVYYNYWGIGCANGGHCAACSKYSSLQDGIEGLGNLTIVKNSTTALDLIQNGHYAYIGAYWITYKSWNDGGCVYFPYIEPYMSVERASQVKDACSKDNCNDVRNGGPGCLKTTDEDQTAYALWQVNDNMSKHRKNIFNLD